MNATTRPRPTTPTAISTPAAKPPRRQEAGNLPAASAKSAAPQVTMDPKEYPKLRDALGEMRSLLYLAQAGVELIDLDEPKGLEFIAKGLTGYLNQFEKQMDIADKAAFAIAPRASEKDATRLLVKTLVAQGRIQVSEADMPALVCAYEAERAAADEAGEPDVTCGVMLDRAMRRMKVEAA